MSWTQNCNLLSMFFVGALLCAIVGNGFGIAAWKHRADDQTRWRWLVDPTYAFRARYYKNARQFTRYAAMSLLTIATLLLGFLCVAVITASRTGARGICGFSF